MIVFPKISVVMPVYNGENYLHDSIESILNQDFSDFEFIIVDDASSDSSIDILNKFKQLDNRIRILSNKTNLGIAESTNIGVEKAKGKYVALMDQDDISCPKRLGIEFNFLENNPQISVVGGDAVKFDEKGNYYQRRKLIKSPGLLRWSFLFRNEIQNPTVLMRKNIFTKYGYKYEPYEPCQDYRLWLKLNQKFWFANINETFIYTRIHNRNTSKTLSSLSNSKIINIRKDFINDYFGIELPINIIESITNNKLITNNEDAKQIASLVVSWQRESRKWNLEASDSLFIKWKTSQIIRNIWIINDRDLRFIPYVFYSILIFPRKVNHREI